MIKEIKHSGNANEVVDYCVTLTGEDLSNRFFFESLPDADRFFSGGNEFIISASDVRYRGTGGRVCEYMFGVDLPLKDLLRKDVSNRLVMHGAFYDTGDHISFSNSTAGRETFDQIFLTGNAVSNYYFFVHFSQQRELRDEQRDILRSIGKSVKRSEMVGANDDSGLCREIFDALNDPRALVFLFRFLNRHHQEYIQTFSRLHLEHKTLTDADAFTLEALAKKYRIIPYQQERIKIDGMYKLAENKKLVDEYKDILIAVSEKGDVNASDLAKLSRLRTLSLRLNIPSTLFDTLDERLLKDMNIVAVEEPDYIRDTRAIFEGLFFRPDKVRGHISHEDLIKLLKAKEKSAKHHDPAFESLLLDTVRACDEHERDTNDTAVLESMSNVLTYFDRYDSASTTINNLAFMENSTISENAIRSIYGNKGIFDSIGEDIFRELFIESVKDNRYLTRYGRKKIDTLYRGLLQIKSGDSTYRELATAIQKIHEDEKLYTLIHRYVKDRFKNTYAELNSRDDQDKFIQGLNFEIQSKGLVQGPVPQEVFKEIILDIRKESFYLNNLLPHIIVSRDNQVREDFLTNSGLDRFYVEELEKDYFGVNRIAPQILEEIRK